jgi:anthranilate synthase component II
MKILVFDNYDSFTYNLVHAVRKCGFNDIEVHRNDKIKIEDIGKFDKIILSPGPGLPSESGILNQLIEYYASSKSILGVCLGEQAIAEVFGAKLLNMKEVKHGVDSYIKVVANDILFNGFPKEFKAGRYHSWVVDEASFPDCLEVIARDETGLIMALRHKVYDLRGVQFHPESVLTPDGERILSNWLKA